MDIDDILGDIGCGKFHVCILLSIIPITWTFIMMFLSPSFLLPAISCYWNLNEYQSSFIMSGLFGGMYIGAPIFGRWSDQYGRMKLFRIAFYSMCYYTFLLVFTPRIELFLILYTIIGIFLNGAVICIKTYLCEIFPTKNREVGIMTYSIFAATGSVLASLCSYNVMSQYGWRYFMIACISPGLISLLTMFWIPESPRYLLLNGKEEKCVSVLASMAKMNRCTNYNLSNLKSESKKWKASKNELFTKKYILVLIGVSIICLNIGFSYYGLVILSNFIHNFSKGCLTAVNSTALSKIPYIVDTSCCQSISKESYKTSIISSFAEVPAIIIMWVISKYFGRKIVFLMGNFILILTMLAISVCLPNYIIDIVLFISRGTASGLRAFNALYGNEVFPTSIRSMGFGISSCFVIIGIVISLFVIMTSVKSKEIWISSSVFCVSNVIAGLIVFLLPETKDKKMTQTAIEDTTP